MNELFKQLVDKISSYNIFNNLFPGALFCYLSKILFDFNIISNSWGENLIIFYFVGLVFSRIGSIIIEPAMKSIKIKKKLLLQHSNYPDYAKASKEDPLISTLSEINNTYRTLLACMIGALFVKVYVVINKMCIEHGFSFFHDNKDWIIVVLLVVLFSLSYVKQTSYVKKRVDAVINRINEKSDNVVKDTGCKRILRCGCRGIQTQRKPSRKLK